MSPLSGISQWMANTTVSPGVERAFLATNKEGPMAILPLELSTTAGRSYTSAKRSGFLEFQERFIEEVLVAIVWLGGVSFMRHRFNGLKNRIFPRLNHLNLDTAWNAQPFKKAASVDLTPAQRFTKNTVEQSLLSKTKLASLIFSVGTATLTAALLIPWFNKQKTEWIVRYLERHETASEHQKLASLAQVEQRQSIPLKQNITRAEIPIRGFPPIPPQPFMTVQPFMGSANGIKIKQISSVPASSTPATQSLVYQPPRFGLSSALASAGSLLQSGTQRIGHAIEQTNYGSILAVDGGLAAGRMKVYGDRNPYESIEIMIRDIGSIYFYMYSTPHLMQLFSKAVSPLVGADVLLEPKVAYAVQAEMLQSLLFNRLEQDASFSQQINALPIQNLGEMLTNQNNKALSRLLLTPTGEPLRKFLAQVPVSEATLHELLGDREHQKISQATQLPLSQLSAEMGSAGKTELIGLLSHEISAYGAQSAYPLLEKAIQGIPGDTLSIVEIQHLLQQIQDGVGDFEVLPKNQRLDVDTAIRQAFRHTTGINSAGHSQPLPSHPAVRQLAERLPAEEHSAFWKRTTALGQQDARDIANSMLRRCLNLAQDMALMVGDNPNKVHAQGEILADWLELATAKQQSLGEVAYDALDDLTERLTSVVQGNRTSQISQTLSIEPLIEELANGEPVRVQSALLRLEEGLQAYRPNVSTRMKNAYLNRQGLLEQVHALNQLLQSTPLVSASGLGKPKPGLANAASLDEMARGNITHYLETLQAQLRKTNASSAAQALIQRYGESIPQLLDGSQWRLFSLALPVEKSSDPVSQGILQKLAALLDSSLSQDSRLIQKGLDIAGKLKPHSRFYQNPKEYQAMQRGIEGWNRSLLAFLAKQSPNASADLGQVLGSIEKFRRISQNGHYLARTLSLGLSMLGLGLLVPSLQNAMTRKLTGKNQHPGIAALHHNDKHTGKPDRLMRPSVNQQPA